MCYAVLSQGIILAIYCYSFLSFPFLPDILSWPLVKRTENEHVSKNNSARKDTSQLLILFSFQIVGWSLQTLSDTKYTYIFLLHPSCVVKGNTLSETRKLTVFIPRSKKSRSRPKCHHLRFVSNLVGETCASNFKDPSSRNISPGQWRDGDLTIKALPGLLLQPQPQAPVALLPNRGRKLDLVQVFTWSLAGLAMAAPRAVAGSVAAAPGFRFRSCRARHPHSHPATKGQTKRSYSLGADTATKQESLPVRLWVGR